METHRASDDVTYSAGEPGDLDRPAESIRQLLEQDLGVEAVTRFSRLRPPDQVDVLARLTRESQAELLSMLTPNSVGIIMGELEPTDAVELSQDMEPEQLSQVLDETSPEVAADVLRGLPEEVASSTLERMEEAEGVTPLLEYEDDDAGGLMTPQFIALRDTMTVMQAMAFVRRWAPDLDPEDVSYLFAVDENGVLKGGISLAQLVVARPYQHVSLLINTDVLSVPVETDQEPCARLMERYNVRNLPVVDDAGKLVGVLKMEDMVDVLEDEATVVAAISGVLVPLGFKAMRIDPALASAVAVTTVTDVLGFLVYLGLASATIGLITRTL